MLKGTIHMPVGDKTRTREQQLEGMLRQIVNKALRPEQMPSTHHMVQKVPAGLIEQARELLEGDK
jgi:hypothetical protein